MSKNTEETDITILIITGAINIKPYSIPGTSLIDINERFSQYIYSIEFAIENYHEITHFIFCENTDYNFDYSFLYNKAHQNNKILEVLSFKGSYQIIQKQGKGYGEGEIIQYVINNSIYIKECSFFLKLTGRLIVKNMDEIITTTKADCAFEMIPQYIYNNPRNYISTIFYKVNKSFYMKVLSDEYKKVDDLKENYLENIFFERLSDLDLKSFKVSPHISGQSGSTNQYYDLNLISKIKQKILYFFGIVNIKKTMTEKIVCTIIIIFFRAIAILKRADKQKNHNVIMPLKNN